jgi:RND family efflux transporter MFP subunit
MPAPRLDITGPVTGAFAVIALFLGGGVGAAAWAPIDKGVGLSGQIIVETKVKAVQHPRGGIVGRLHVAEGQEVTAGQTLVTLDTRALDEQIAALKAQAAAARRQLDLIREEASTMTELLERKLAARSKVLALERQVAEVEKETAGLNARISLAEQDLQRSEIRSPVAGRVLSMAVAGAGAVIQAGATVLEIVPENDKLVIEGRLSPAHIDSVKPGMPARVWLTTLSWRDSHPFEARLAWVSPDTVEDKRSGASTFLARVELDEPRTEIARRFTLHPGMRAEILLLTGQRRLLDQLLDPLLRNINRAFRA